MSRDPHKPGYDGPPGIWENECAIELANGRFICTDAFPNEPSYIRVLDADLHEIVYWSIDEIREDPEDVLGAFFGAMKGKADGESP
jgi:hypothetical protein